ncbi:MAG TPA: hypothetical protein PLK69_04025, partial [Tetrasphaera sp.]|nr:hypothetical protein [Tetrasphaera sp.]
NMSHTDHELMRTLVARIRAAGGSLSVTSGSPTVVTAGDPVAIEVAWSGLSAGEEYLGTLDHAIDGTRVASTVVQVTP